MGFLERLEKALGVGGDDPVGGAGEAAGGAEPTLGPISEKAAPAGPRHTIPLFIERTGALSVDQWRQIEGAWQSASGDPTRLVARAAAEQRAEELARVADRTVEFASEMNGQLADDRSRTLAMTDPALRHRVSAMEAQLRGRSEVMRDALLALSVRDLLSAEDFIVLYAPFEPFVPRDGLERYAEDWGPSLRQEEPPANPPSAADADPWRDLPGGWSVTPESSPATAEREPEARRPRRRRRKPKRKS